MNKRAKIILVASFTICSLIGVLKHITHSTTGFDVAFVNQSLFYPFGDVFLKSDFSGFSSTLGEHLSFTFVLLAPLLSLFKSDLLVIFVHYLLVLFPVYHLLFSKEFKLQKNIVFLVVIICLFRTLQSSLIWNFREDIIAFCFLLLFIMYLYKKLFIRSFLFMLVAIASKENVALVTMFVPFVFLVDERYSRQEKFFLSLSISLTSITYFLLSFGFIIPFFTEGELTVPIANRYGGYGSNNLEIIKYIILNITEVVDFSLSNLAYLVKLFLIPVVIGFYGNRKFFMLIPALAGAFINIAGNSKNQISMNYHYDLVILPFIIMFLVLNLDDVEMKLKKTLVFLSVAMGGLVQLVLIKHHWPSRDDIMAYREIKKIKNPVIVDTGNAARVNHLEKYYALKNIKSNADILSYKLPVLVFKTKNKELVKFLTSRGYHEKVIHPIKGISIYQE